MNERGDAARRPARASMPPRTRRRWQIAAGVVALWIILWLATGSLAGAFIFLIALAALGAAAFFGLRALGVNRDHPWVQRISSRPWRDGQDVLQQALKHLPEVFVVTPNGALMAPDVVDLRMNPDDLAVLGERMDPSVVMESAAEVYQETVAAHHARLARRAPVEVRIIADPGMPPGRFRLRQGQPVNNYIAPDGPDAHGAPEVRGAPAAHGAPEVRGAPAAHGAPEAYGAPGSHGAPGAYGFSEVHGAPEAYGAREVHGGPGAHDAPGAYGAPEVRGAPGAHGAPDAYGAPDIPRAPENPRAPQNPRLPENPRVPENPYASPAPQAPQGSPAPYPRPQLVPDHGRYPASDGYTRAQDQTATVGGVPTMMESNHQGAPPLRLITGGKVAETTFSGARAGRGRSVELGLPEVPTVSREHAKFTYSGGQWYVTNLGMNGITLNGQAVTGEHAVHSGDSIRWGTRPDALQSEVEIG